MTLAALVILGAACSGPRLRVDEAPDSGVVQLELGPLSLSWWARLSLDALLTPEELEAPEGTWVHLTFPRTDFQKVRIYAGGKSFTYSRTRFHEHRTKLPLTDFRTIARSPSVAFQFDERAHIYRLEPDELALVQLFAERLDVAYENLPGRDPDSKTTGPHASGNRTLGTFSLPEPED